MKFHEENETHPWNDLNSLSLSNPLSLSLKVNTSHYPFNIHMLHCIITIHTLCIDNQILLQLGQRLTIYNCVGDIITSICAHNNTCKCHFVREHLMWFNCTHWFCNIMDFCLLIIYCPGSYILGAIIKMMNTIKMNLNYRLGEGSPLTIDYLYTDLKKVIIFNSLFNFCKL